MGGRMVYIIIFLRGENENFCICKTKYMPGKSQGFSYLFFFLCFPLYRNVYKVVELMKV